MYKILVVDDHSIVRAGIAYLMANEAASFAFEDASDGEKAVACLKESRFDLVIVDIHIPGTDTVGLIRYILTQYPDTHLMVFSMNEEAWFGRRFLQMGVKGYLSKESPDDEVRTAIWTVLKGKRHVSNQLARQISEEVLDGRGENPFDLLSSREFEVLLQLVKGDSVSAIAETLNLHTSTVGTHKAHVFQKLGVQNIVQLTNLANLYGILSGQGKTGKD